jgi:hypothetical protein
MAVSATADRGSNSKLISVDTAVKVTAATAPMTPDRVWWSSVVWPTTPRGRPQGGWLREGLVRRSAARARECRLRPVLREATRPLGACGVPFSGADAGGFAQHPGRELYLRWFQLASFLGFFRTHSAFHLPARELGAVDRRRCPPSARVSVPADALPLHPGVGGGGDRRASRPAALVGQSRRQTPLGR